MLYQALRGMLLTVILLFSLPAGQAVTTPQSPDKTAMQKPESPFACNVKALDTTQRRRWMELLHKLNEAKQEVRELPDGYAFRFPAEAATIQEVAEFINYERLCCPFFALELALEREGGPLWLRFKGREGVKVFIRSEFKLE